MLAISTCYGITNYVSADSSFTFTKSLKLGMIDNEVKELQIFLNNNGFPVALTGIGSSGQETNYFGNLTKKAVTMFQEANRSEILDPQGLTQGTGAFFASTRGLINRILAKNSIAVDNNASVPGNESSPVVEVVTTPATNPVVVTSNPSSPEVVSETPSVSNPLLRNRRVIVSAPVIAGVTAPVTGATPVSTLPGGIGYTATIAWSGSPATFASATVYTATITLHTVGNYIFSGVPANFFTVAGATATNALSSGVITAVFPVTATTIATAAVAGVTAPVTGATPVSTLADGTGYTATIAWSGNPVTFASATAYTATITLTPKTGYTLAGVPANFFTVAGATATNSINAGVITAVFPATATTIAAAAISGVTAPVAGATPVSTLADGTGYTATIAWSPVAETFANSTVYTATITITAKTGYTLVGVPVNFFTVAGATATNSANAGVVSAVFPETEPAD